MDGIKELLTYLTNQFKFWFIIKEWEHGLHLRCGKIKRELRCGMYFKIPFLDSVFVKHKRIQDVVISQINFTTKDDEQITVSAAAFFRISNVRDFYNGYAEPLSIVDGIIKNEINSYFLSIDYFEFSSNNLESTVLEAIKSIKGKGILFNDFKLTTFSNAKTYRLITDKLYSQPNSYLDDERY